MMDQEGDIEEGLSESYYADNTEPVEEEIEDHFYDREEEGEEGEEEEVPGEEDGRNRRRKHRESGDRRESRKRRSRDDNEDRHKSRRRSGEDSYDGKEKRRSGGEYSDYESEGRSHRKHRSEEREGKSRRKHHKHKRDKSRKSKSRTDSRGSHDMEPEEGELEDGEIDEEEDIEDHHDAEYPLDDGRNDKKYNRENRMMGPPGPPGPMMMPRPQGPPEGFGPNMYPENDRHEGFNHDQGHGHNEMEHNAQNNEDVNQEPPQDVPKMNDDPNKEKLAMMGLDPDTLNSLPAKQKELFLRLQGNKSAGEESPKHDTQDDGEQIKKEPKDEPKQEKDVDDDWYSSDEEEGKGKKPKLTDILKNLNKQASTPESPQSATPNPSSALSVMQMINAIKTNAGSGNSATSPIGSPTHLPRDPRQRLDPRTGKPGGPAIIPIDGPEAKIEPPTFINSYEGDIALYRLVPMSKDNSTKGPPPGLNLNDPQFKSDPRIQRMLKRMEATRGQTLDSGSVDMKSSSKENKPVDPRSAMGSGMTDRPNDPRVKGSDPRIQRTISDTGGPKPQDPRLLRVQSTPVGQGAPASDPRLGRQASGPPDPRMLGRQISREGHQDPRLGRQLSNQPTSNFDGSNINRPSDSKPVDPRMSSQLSASSDPRKLNRPNSVNDPRNVSRQNSLTDPRARVQIDQKLDLLTDPRMKPELDISNLKPLDPKIIQSSLEEEADGIASQLEILPETMENNNDQTSIQDQTEKPKLDYRNDPRFKRKPAGKRKSSMDYASPLGDEGGSDGSTYSAYTRPQTSNQRQTKTDLKVKSDPRLSNISDTKTINSPSREQPSPTSSEQSGLLSLPLPELPPFIPPPEPEINTRDFFKTMDPTASPFC
ncbi:hypothetical protein FSP39_012009 [Pinctada imbricata]|uniref:Uncharacterized protein n=1 Tax=Pinctada imbricata TaxID=66713 RepID=A0AA88YQX8_PINIB|nr:hypothetical protein FSP39_012009 [Pinctada imbricata]